MVDVMKKMMEVSDLQAKSALDRLLGVVYNNYSWGKPIYLFSDPTSRVPC